MYIIANSKLPPEARPKLEAEGEVLYFESRGITYPAISGHPDVFMFKTQGCLIVAPNTPVYFLEQLSERNIHFIKGVFSIGKKYPETSHYNVVEINSHLVCHKKYTDPAILELNATKELIHVNQAYTRCNLIALRNDRFITSDEGIEKTLMQRGLEVLFVAPDGILLPGFKHGFIGGTAGISGHKLFFAGSLSHFVDGDKIRGFASDYEIIELYNGPLFDGGGLFFI